MNKSVAGILAAIVAASFALTACQPKSTPSPRPMQTGNQLGECEYEDGNTDGTPCMFDGVYVSSEEYRK